MQVGREQAIGTSRIRPQIYVWSAFGAAWDFARFRASADAAQMLQEIYTCTF